MMKILFLPLIFLLCLNAYSISSYESVRLPVSSWIEVGKCLNGCSPTENMTMCYIRCIAKISTNIHHNHTVHIKVEDLPWHFPEQAKAYKTGTEMKLTYGYPEPKNVAMDPSSVSSTQASMAFLLLKIDSEGETTGKFLCLNRSRGLSMTTSPTNKYMLLLAVDPTGLLAHLPVVPEIDPSLSDVVDDGEEYATELDYNWIIRLFHGTPLPLAIVVVSGLGVLWCYNKCCKKAASIRKRSSVANKNRNNRRPVNAW